MTREKKLVSAIEDAAHYLRAWGEDDVAREVECQLREALNAYDRAPAPLVAPEGLVRRWEAQAAELRARYGEGIITDEYGELWPDSGAQVQYLTLKRCAAELRGDA